MAPGDDVQLPDLQVIQRYSLAVRGATAPAADVIEALQADLAWLTGGGRPRPAASERRSTVVRKSPAAKKPAPAAKKAAAKKTAAKKTGARKA